MKKICNYILFIISSIVLFACAKANTVTNTTIYCSSISFSDDVKASGVVMYVGQTCVFEDDDIVLLPSNCSVGFTLVSNNSDVALIDDGTIIAVGAGSTAVRAYALKNATQYVYDEIEVTILANPVYAQNVAIANALGSDLVLYHGAQGTFELVFSPANYNCGYTFSSSDDCLYVNNAGNYVANGVGVSTLTIEYMTGENDCQTATYNVTIKPRPTQLNVEYSTDVFYATFENMLVSANYSLIATSNIDFVSADLENITLQGATIISKELFGDGVVINFYFESSGAHTLSTQLSLNSFDYNGLLTNEDDVVVYDYVTSVNVSSSPVDIVGNSITLNVCSEGEHINSTQLTIVYNNVATSRGISAVVGNTNIVQFDGGTLTAVAVGTTTLTISTVDGYLEDYVLSINVVPCLIESIDVQFASLDLFVGYDLNDYPSSLDVAITILPTCATEQLTIIASAGLEFSNNKISATASGQYTFKVSSSNCEEQVFVINVYNLPDELQIKYDSTDIKNQTLDIETNTVVEIEYLCLFEDNITEYNYPVEVLCDNENVVIDVSKVNKFVASCTTDEIAHFVVKFGLIEVNFAINFTTSG